MISLQPREQYIIVRQLGDHTDSTTYYVRAVVRNSITGATIATINLTDNGNGRFSKIYEVPSDVSGEGFYVDITTSVYTTSGYTTKAESYSDELEQYLVFDRILKVGGSGGSDIDYKKIEQILTKILESRPKYNPDDLTPLKLILEQLDAYIRGIEIPKYEKPDLSPVISAISNTESNIVKAIDEKEVTPRTDLSIIEDLQNNLLETINNKEPNLDKIMNLLKEIEANLNILKKYVDTERQKDAEEEQKKEMEDEMKIETDKKNERINNLINPSERVKKLL